MNFFVTGDGSVKANIDLKLFTPAESHGANFAADGQSLRQSLSIAREVFSRVEHGKIDFALIGLSPDVLFQGGTVDENLDALTEYLKLCAQVNTKAVCVILPVAPNVRDRYRQKFVTPLCEILTALKALFDFELVDLFDLPMPENYFVDETLTSDGIDAVSTILTFELYERKIFTFADFRRMSYEYFHELSRCLPPKIFHAQMNKVFRATVDELKRKARIKIAFVTDHAATWCGDELYNLFANNKRFEPTIFLCRSGESTLDDARHDVKQFKSRGLNVVGIFDEDTATEPQDVVIFLRPYIQLLSERFQLDAMTPQTLWTHIPYGLKVTSMDFDATQPLYRLAWKVFFETAAALKFFDERCQIGVPRGVVSGHPKLDVFFDAAKKFSFPWKMTRPDAKKIIWAPHWSFKAGEGVHVIMSTFDSNYEFMYEFAKNHPETSWVVKPHPKLAFAAVNSGLFASDAAFSAYLQAWNDLPNALVFTGGYYQDIFATSDGMIQDSGSFLAEYQFTHKPMIYLTRDERPFNELGEKILDVTYRVDGRDFDGIAALIRKVFVDGEDPLKDARRKVFDELLNYRHFNGMTASEFIFHSIADELTR